MTAGLVLVSTHDVHERPAISPFHMGRVRCCLWVQMGEGCAGSSFFSKAYSYTECYCLCSFQVQESMVDGVLTTTCLSVTWTQKRWFLLCSFTSRVPDATELEIGHPNCIGDEITKLVVLYNYSCTTRIILTKSYGHVVFDNLNLSNFTLLTLKI